MRWPTISVSDRQMLTTITDDDDNSWYDCALGDNVAGYADITTAPDPFDNLGRFFNFSDKVLPDELVSILSKDKFRAFTVSEH